MEELEAYSHLSVASLKLHEEMLFRDYQFYKSLSEKLNLCSLCVHGAPTYSSSQLSESEKRLEAIRKEIALRQM